MKQRYIYFLSRVLLVISLGLFLVALAGHWNWFEFNVCEHPDLAEEFENIPVYSIAQLLEYADVRTPIKDGGEQGSMVRIFKATIKKFRHGLANHTIFTNWLIWLSGWLKKEWLEITDTNVLLKYSDHALCGQSAQVMVDVARLLGLRSRIVNLEGHGVMEVYYENSYHMFDPDFEVIPEEEGKILSVQQLIDQPGLIEKFYANNPHTREGETMVGMIVTGHDNTFHKDYAHPSPRIKMGQSILEIFKWILPIAGIIISIFLLIIQKRKRVSLSGELYGSQVSGK